MIWQVVIHMCGGIKYTRIWLCVYFVFVCVCVCKESKKKRSVNALPHTYTENKEKIC